MSARSLPEEVPVAITVYGRELLDQRVKEVIEMCDEIEKTSAEGEGEGEGEGTSQESESEEEE